MKRTDTDTNGKESQTMSDDIDIIQRARERLVGVSLEQIARNLLEECGVEDAQRFTAGDVVALANFVGLIPKLIAEVERLRTDLEGHNEALIEAWNSGFN